MKNHEAQGGLVVNGAVIAPEESLRFAFSNSSGPGGQNVNKRATKCELRVSLGDLRLPADAIERLVGLASWLVTSEEELVITCDESRSQRQNQAVCLERLADLVRRSTVRPKARKKTKPSRSSVQRRLTEKKTHAERKQRRRTPDE